MDKAQRDIGVNFDSQELLSLALTHRSRGSKNYERLEFLGDSILGFVVARWLYHNYPDIAEGKLSRMRSSLVRKESLASVARDLNLSEHLILGEGELKSGGFNRESILADTVESIIGAIYLDQGLPQAERFIEEKFAKYFEDITPNSTFKDSKSSLQEVMQKRGLSLPEYSIVRIQGEQHNQEFTVECLLGDVDIRVEETAKSRRSAEQAAATKALASFKKQEPSKRRA